jgi:hypothetical protein
MFDCWNAGLALFELGAYRIFMFEANSTGELDQAWDSRDVYGLASTRSGRAKAWPMP